MSEPEPVAPYKEPQQWTRSDLDHATAAGQHVLIDQALRAGQLSNLLTGTNDDKEQQ